MITNNTFHPCRSLQVQPNYHFYFINYKKKWKYRMFGKFTQGQQTKKIIEARIQTLEL